MAEPTPRPARRTGARRSRRPGRPRGEAGPDLREALLDAATALAVERGFETVGLREIAQRAGASPGMIAYYFGDRHGLQEALLERAFDRVTRQVEALLAAGGAKETDLDELVRLHVTALASDPWIPQLIAREVLGRTSRMRDAFAKRVAEGPMRAVRRFIEDGIAAGHLRSDLDPELTAMSISATAIFPYLFGPIVGPTLGLDFGDALRDRLIEHNRRLLSLGIRARPEHSP